jgi:putative sigma-54 modulation protein
MELAVRTRNLPLTEPIEMLVRQRLGFALGRHASEIRRVDVELADINGPRGGIDKRCRVDVILSHGGRIRAESTDLRVRDAIDGAARRVGRRVARLRGRDATQRRHDRLAI